MRPSSVRPRARWGGARMPQKTVNNGNNPVVGLRHGGIVVLRWTFFLVLMFSQLAADSRNESPFTWETDEWSSCNHTGCGQGHVQTRTVRCLHGDGWTGTADRCDALTTPATTRRCFHVCEHHRFQYHWKVDRWSNCRPKHRNVHCAENYGTKTRRVQCVSKCGARPAPSEDLCEHFEEKPAAEESCDLECSQHCIVSEFGPWNECRRCGFNSRTRYRTVLALPKNGGHVCPDLSQHQPCSVPKNCMSYTYKRHKYKVGNWTECIQFRGDSRRNIQKFSSLLGHRRRTVDCIDSKGFLVELKYCSKLDKPPSAEICVLPKNCQVSHWSNWTSYSQPYYRPITESRSVLTRERSVVQLPRGSGEECPTLEESRKEQPRTPRTSCNRYKWMTGEWEDCRTQVESDDCGPALQNRTVLCVRSGDTIPVPDSFCGQEASESTRVCTVPCPQHCIVTSWSPWSLCQPQRCQLGRDKQKDGYRIRMREIIREGRYGGRRCPYLQESKSCEYPPCYSWKTRTSGECKMNYPDAPCGAGLRNRTSECVSVQGKVFQAVLCMGPKPSSQEVCNMPCPNACVVSDWSEWSECPRDCNVRWGAVSRTRKKEILAFPVHGGAPCPPPRLLEEKEKCGEYTCARYHWWSTEWSECQPREGVCGPGIQYRKVYCRRENGQQVAAKRCVSDIRPVENRNCSVQCHGDCAVSEFTDWTPCPVTCIPDGMRFLPEQKRRRYVLKQATHHGLKCPSLEESRPCVQLPHCEVYTWHLPDWSECYFANDFEQCGHGYRAREIRCMNSREEFVPGDICAAQVDQTPEVTQPCHVVCDASTCTFSDWTEWGACSKRCGGRRERQRRMEGLTDRIADCYDTAKYPLLELLPCPCPSYTAEPMDRWSHCILNTDRPTETEPPALSLIGELATGSGYCGVGRRFQAKVCKSPDGDVASASVCGASDFVEEMCFTPCPRDCQMSEWSEWRRCRMPIGSRCGIGTQTRSRYLMESSLDGGRKCPTLTEDEEYQQQPCYRACDQYFWVAGEWSICVPVESLSGADSCGVGLQSRIVRCLRHNGEEEVDESMCDDVTKPEESNYCHVPCPGQCVLTSWGPWSRCMHDCSGTRERFRRIMRYPSVGSISKCPALSETAQCVQGENCHVYDWHWSSWGACALPKSAICGEGIRMRYRECRRNGLQPVAKELCFNLQSGHSSLLEEGPCSVSCPIDCVLSQWTEWSECSNTCGIGFQSRSRSILVFPQHGGRACPDGQQQQRPCPYVECFHWQLSDWSRCKVEAGSCGYGTQWRNLTCLRHDGVTSDPSLCPSQAKRHVKLEQSCFQSCPGDCQVSQWSDWSPCQRPCHIPNYNPKGEQVRSRAILSHPRSSGEPCPKDLWDTRPCDGDGFCPLYSWQTGYWFGNSRDVWCERSDGLRLSGGCIEAHKPGQARTCNPECYVQSSYCSDIDTCSCERGYTPIYVSDELKKCVRIVVKHNKTGSEAGVDNEALYFPEGGHSNFWMYAVIAAGSAFIIFVAVALYTLCRHHRKQRSSRNAKAGVSGAVTRGRSDGSDNTTPLVEGSTRHIQTDPS